MTDREKIMEIFVQLTPENQERLIAKARELYEKVRANK